VKVMDLLSGCRRIGLDPRRRLVVVDQCGHMNPPKGMSA
jgi:hypothetical protein